MATKTAKAESVPGHKCTGARVMHYVNCECGWSSDNWGSRRSAYAQWRTHAQSHIGTIDACEVCERTDLEPIEAGCAPAHPSAKMAGRYCPGSGRRFKRVPAPTSTAEGR